MIIGIQDEILWLQSLGLLDALLEDKTTKANILWATDAYKKLGPEYERDQEIMPMLITGQHSGVIRNRARKEMEQQSQRTRQHAEVFTPLWVCNMMNNYADETWFGRPDVFNKNGVSTEHIDFPEERTWKEYVDSRRLEITCGEAPYLVSRYDVSTGESIRIEDRIGMLDRKLRVVNENATTEAEWLTWAIRAFEATYGYEFQGDNVLIARVNLLMTFEEYMVERWNRRPTKREYQHVSNIVVWNIWQMDGLTGTIPYSKAEDDCLQMTLFAELESRKSNEQPLCRIYDWRSKCSLDYLSMREGNGNYEV